MRIGEAVLSPAPAASRAAGYAKSVDTRAKILAAALAEASDAGFPRTSRAQKKR